MHKHRKAVYYVQYKNIQRDSKRWTQFCTTIFPEIYVVCEWSTWHLKVEILSCQILPLERLVHSRSAASDESKMATMHHKIFFVREFIKTESPTAVQRVFRLRFNIHPPTRKSICRWNHQFEQIGCLCKGKSSGRPRVSEENVRRIQESFELSPRKSTRSASKELGIPQPSGVCWCAVYCSTESIFLNHPVLCWRYH